MKKIFSLFAALTVAVSTIWADSPETLAFSSSDNGITIVQAGAGEPGGDTKLTKGDITVTSAGGQAQANKALQIYKGNSMTVAVSSGYNITSIAFTYPTKCYPFSEAIPSGLNNATTKTESGKTAATFTPSTPASSFTFTNVADGQTKVNKMVVTYSVAGPVDPTINTTDKSVEVDKLFDVSTMFTSNSTGSITYSVTAAPTGANYDLDGADFLATTLGEYTIQASQAAVSGKYNSATATAVLTVIAPVTKYDVNCNAPAHGSYTIKIGDAEAENVTEADLFEAAENVNIVLTSSAAQGYKLADNPFTVATESGSVDVAKNGNNYSFSMPAEAVTITANYEESTDLIVTYNFNNPANFPKDFPTSGTTKATAQTFTIDGNAIIINANNGYYVINSTTENCGLFFGKTSNESNIPQSGTSYLGFPAKEGYKLTKVVATSTNNIVGGLPLNIYTTTLVAVSTASNTVNGAKTAHTFEIANSAENTEYWLTAGGSSGKNLQFDNIVLTYEKVTPIYTEANVDFVASNNSGYWATFSSENVTFWPEDVIVYKAAISGDALELSALAKEEGNETTGYFVPANTGVLVNSRADEFTYYTVENKTVTALENNNLYPASKDKAELPNHMFYMLARDAEGANLGFYWGAADGAAFTSREGSAYLAVPSIGAPARFVLSDLNDKVPTAVENSSLNTEVKKVVIDGQMMILRDGNLFDLNGRLVK